ncbi:MAG: Ig-like domain-containing protein [Gammaproteobacteria bacterium]
MRTFTSVARTLATTTAMAAVASCGGGDDGYGNGGSGGGGGTTLQANFASIQDNVFTPICTSCHTGAGAPQGLRLDSANSYALLVGVASEEQPALQRVVAGDPNDSYLIKKLEGTASVGGRMPLGGMPLAQSDIDVIRQWITDGAQPTAGTVTTPVRVTSLSPLPDSTLQTVPTSIMAVLDRALDATSVDATTVLVQRSGGDGTFGDGNEVTITPVSVTVPAGNTKTIVVDISTAPPIEDDYRITLVGTGATMIRDLGGNALDGEFAGAFPSGDSTQGGNFVATFTVEGIQPTLQSIQDNVFTPICAGCHTGPTSGALPGGMDLTTAAHSAASLINVAAIENGAQKRVLPNDADNSYLIEKLEGTAGSQMPLGGQPLSAATVATIRAWITSGVPQ